MGMAIGRKAWRRIGLTADSSASLRNDKQKSNGKGNRRSFDYAVRKVREQLRSG
jgi:hypothetical protein